MKNQHIEFIHDNSSLYVSLDKVQDYIDHLENLGFEITWLDYFKLTY